MQMAECGVLKNGHRSAGPKAMAGKGAEERERSGGAFLVIPAFARGEDFVPRVNRCNPASFRFIPGCAQKFFRRLRGRKNHEICKTNPRYSKTKMFLNSLKSTTSGVGQVS
jgi:hypothetical protein